MSAPRRGIRPSYQNRGALESPLVKVFALSIHADYRCQQTGLCCQTGWSVPVEHAVDQRLRREIGEGRLGAGGQAAVDVMLPRRSGLPAGMASVLGQDPRGRCLFLDGKLCSIHTRLGTNGLPASCRLFPRVCLLEPRGISITLSHYCPTAARMLLTPERGLEIVENPDAFPAGFAYEGLDVRTAWPPLLRPDVLLDWESHALWERHAVELFATGGAPEAVLSRLACEADLARSWSVAKGPLRKWMTSIVAAPDRGTPTASRPGWSLVEPAAAYRSVLAAVPDALRPADRSASLADDERWVAPAWQGLSGSVCRYLAAKAFASWCAHQGRGLRTGVAYLVAAHAVLRVEAAAACTAAGRRLDTDLLVEAFRRADLLLLHLASREALTERLAAVEDAAPEGRVAKHASRPWG